MNGLEQALNDLRDIHLPDPIPLWPPAIGWWAVLALSLLCLYGLYRLIRFIKRLSRRKAALLELKNLHIDYKIEGDLNQFVIGVSILLRRVSIAVFGRKEVAGLIGKPWLRFLDQHAEDNNFTEGVGRVLVTAPYSRHEDFDSVALVELIQSWIKRNT